MTRRASRRPKDEPRRRRPVHAAPSQQRGRVLAFAGLTVTVLALATFFLWPAVRQAWPVSSDGIAIELSMGGFSPREIETRAGEPITVRLINKDNRFHTDGGGWHQFAIDEEGVDVKVAPLATQELTFTPTQSGTVTFYCDVCCGGRESPFMQGTLTVRA